MNNLRKSYTNFRREYYSTEPPVCIIITATHTHCVDSSDNACDRNSITDSTNLFKYIISNITVPVHDPANTSYHTHVSGEINGRYVSVHLIMSDQKRKNMLDDNRQEAEPHTLLHKTLNSINDKNIYVFDIHGYPEDSDSFGQRIEENKGLVILYRPEQEDFAKEFKEKISDKIPVTLLPASDINSIITRKIGKGDDISHRLLLEFPYNRTTSSNILANEEFWNIISETILQIINL